MPQPSGCRGRRRVTCPPAAVLDAHDVEEGDRHAGSGRRDALENALVSAANRRFRGSQDFAANPALAEASSNQPRRLAYRASGMQGGRQSVALPLLQRQSPTAGMQADLGPEIIAQSLVSIQGTHSVAAASPQKLAPVVVTKQLQGSPPLVVPHPFAPVWAVQEFFLIVQLNCAGARRHLPFMQTPEQHWLSRLQSLFLPRQRLAATAKPPPNGVSIAASAPAVSRRSNHRREDMPPASVLVITSKRCPSILNLFVACDRFEK